MSSLSYFDKFDGVIRKYMPVRGQGDTMASQVVTAVNKLVYKWYNDGDVYDNTAYLRGWVNDLSSYANWLRARTPVDVTLDSIYDCQSEDDYEVLLVRLADSLLDEDVLAIYEKIPAIGSIYDCDGPFKFVEREDEDEDEEDEW